MPNKLHKIVLRACGELHVGHRLRLKYVLNAMNKFNLSDKHILDAGCGNGVYAEKLAVAWPSSRINAIDLSLDGIEDNLPKNITIAKKDLTALDIDSQYDLIYTVDVLEHIIDDKIVLANFFHALKQSGFLIIHVPLESQEFIPHRFLIKNRPTQEDHIRDGYNEIDLLNKIALAKFEIINKTYTFGWFGSLAWFLMKLYENNRLRYRILVHPLNLLLMQLDFWLPKRRAEGILIVAKKH